MEPPQEAEPLWPTAVQPDISPSAKERGGRPAGISGRAGPGLLRRRGTPLRAPSKPRASLTSVCPCSETRIFVPRPSVPPLLSVRSPFQRYPGLSLAPLHRWPDRTSRHDPGSLSLPIADRSLSPWFPGLWSPAPRGLCSALCGHSPGSGLLQSHFLLQRPDSAHPHSPHRTWSAAGLLPSLQPCSSDSLCPSLPGDPRALWVCPWTAASRTGLLIPFFLTTCLR